MANKSKKHSAYSKQISTMRKKGMSALEIAQIKQVAARSTEDLEQRALRTSVHKALMLTLGVPMSILKEDYWKKADNKKIKKFVEDCYQMYHAWDSQVISDEEIMEVFTDVGIDIEEYWKELDERYGWKV